MALHILQHRIRKRKVTYSGLMKPIKYEAQTTAFWIVWEVLLSGLMITCILLYFYYATGLVADSVFKTR